MSRYRYPDLIDRWIPCFPAIISSQEFSANDIKYEPRLATVALDIEPQTRGSSNYNAAPLCKCTVLSYLLEFVFTLFPLSFKHI